MSNNSLKNEIIKSLNEHKDKNVIISDSGVFTYQMISDYLFNMRSNISFDNRVIVSLCDRNINSIVCLLFAILTDNIFFPLDATTNKEVILNQVKELNGVIFTDKNETLMQFNDDNYDLVVFDFLKKEYFSKLNIKKNNILKFDRRIQYIYSTSGSISTPKQVLGRGDSLMDFLQWEIRQFDLNSNDCFLNITKPFFDPYLRDILIPVLLGATIFIPDNQIVLRYDSLVKYLVDNQITIIHTIPSIFRNLIKQEYLYNSTKLKYFFLAGELLYSKDVNYFYYRKNRNTKVVNLYGPTETTLAKFYYIVNDPMKTNVVPVGKPINNKFSASVYIDKCREFDFMYDNKEVGEIIIHTNGASFGYLDKSMNAPFEFLENDYIKFHTQDYGYVNDFGDLVINGRLNNVIKINGEKIDLNEITICINENNIVQSGCVIDILIDDKIKIVAAVVLNSKNKFSNIHSILNEYLYLNGFKYVPQFYLELDELPTLSNGKLNKNELRKMALDAIEKQKCTFKTSENKILEKLMSIIYDTIGLNFEQEVSMKTKLIDFGVDSLLMIEIIITIEAEFNIYIDETKLELSTLSIEDLIKIINE